jgi:hypothetical protein
MKDQHITNKKKKPGLPRRHRRRHAKQNLDKKVERKFSYYICDDRSERSNVTTTYAKLGQVPGEGRG